MNKLLLLPFDASPLRENIEPKSSSFQEYSIELEQTLTLVLGAVCKDGTVIVADRKVVKPNYELKGYYEKLAGVLENVIFGFSGVDLAFDFFKKYVCGDVVLAKGTKHAFDSKNVISRVSKIVRTMNENMYRLLDPPEKNPQIALEMLVARHFPSNHSSDLYWIPQNRKAQRITNYKAIGSAEKTARVLLGPRFSTKNLTMKEFVREAYFVIRYIETIEPCGTIGIGRYHPMVRYLGNEMKIDEEPSEVDLKAFRKEANQKVLTHLNALR